MSVETGKSVAEVSCTAECEQLQHDFQHLRSQWWWLFLFGILLAVCGTAAIIFPALTVLGTLTAVVVLGTVLIIAGIATIVTAFWAGQWSGVLVQIPGGPAVPGRGLHDYRKAAGLRMTLTLFVATLFIVVGGFRILAALLVRFPYWGWAAERHRHVPGGRDHLPSFSAERDLGAGTAGGPGNAVSRLDLDHALPGYQRTSGASGLRAAPARFRGELSPTVFTDGPTAPRRRAVGPFNCAAALPAPGQRRPVRCCWPRSRTKR